MEDSFISRQNMHQCKNNFRTPFEEKIWPLVMELLTNLDESPINLNWLKQINQIVLVCHLSKIDGYVYGGRSCSSFQIACRTTIPIFGVYAFCPGNHF